MLIWLTRGCSPEHEKQLAACQQVGQQGREAEADAAQQSDTGPKLP